MEKDRISIQVISTPFAQSFGADAAVDYCKRLNNYLYDHIKDYPDKFRAFAAFPTAIPETCTDELERCIKELSVVETLIGNRVNGEFVCESKYDAILIKAVELSIPIFIYPDEPPQTFRLRFACYPRDSHAKLNS